MENTFTIGDLAREFGVTLRTLRFYEDKHLLHPRRQGTNRVYGARDRARLKLVLLGRRVGFSLSEIRELIDLADLRDARPSELKAALSRYGEQVEALRRQKRDVEQAIEELTRTMAIVADLLRSRDGHTAEPRLEAAE